jgi:hypothetical protein
LSEVAVFVEEQWLRDAIEGVYRLWTTVAAVPDISVAVEDYEHDRNVKQLSGRQLIQQVK